MTKSRLGFKIGFDSYSAWTHCESFQQDYKTFPQSQVTLKVITGFSVAQASNPTLLK
jgi:hypothetical protein